MIYYRIKNGKTKDNKPIFKIVDKNGNLVDNKTVADYITKLVIPPAYENVKIFYEKTPKILFEGFDDKGRKQQIYSKSHKKKALKKKFSSLLKFGKVLPKINADIEKNMKQKSFSKNKIISIILKIIMFCGFRVGNLKYQKLYNSFGISNILKEHIKIFKKGGDLKMLIKFVGKKGVINECIITDSTIIKEIAKLTENKKNKEYVFTYDKKNSGKKNSGKKKETKSKEVIKALDINNWLKLYHEDITSKSFRTWDTNILFIEHMRHQEDPVMLSAAKRKKEVVAAMKIISCQINNTPSICKKEYLHSELFNLYINHPKKYKKYFFGCNKAPDCFMNFLRLTIK